MTREQIYAACVEQIAKTNCLLLESATGTGKTKISIDLVNDLLQDRLNMPWQSEKDIINVLILVAKRVHKQTWQDEINKWGGINHPTAKINLCMECYESLKNHCNEHWDIILADEVHHIGSEIRLQFLKTMSFEYFLGLSATIPRKLKQFFKYRYHSEVVSCDIIEAIEDDVLPEPEILLFPLMVDNRAITETWEFFPKAPGPVIHAEYKDIKKYKFNKNIHSIISMTQKQKLIEYNSLIEYFKKQTMQSHNPAVERSWLFQAGKRLEFLAEIKLPIIHDILQKLDKSRTITFCKTIQQAELAGRWCIHSKNSDADKYYQDFNAKKINHITAVNILNENANLVDCKYAIFCNLSSSDIVIPQRLGRAMRHKHPVIIVPYYQDTREQEIVEKMFSEYNRDYIRVIHSIQEI
jgi:superfamily II DNA or RNA helicase